MQRYIHILVLLATALLLGACTAARPPVPSGFLGEAGTMGAPCAEARPVAPPATGISVDPVVFAGAAGEVAWCAGERERLAVKLEAVLRSEFGKRLPLADSPASGALRLRTAVTRLHLAQPVVNAVSELLVFVPVARGGVAVEFELVDAEGRRVAAWTAARNGSLVQTISALRRTGHAEAAFAVLAAEFAAGIDWAPALSGVVVAER